MKGLHILVLLVVVVCFVHSGDGWGRRRRRRPYPPCNWARWNSWNYNCRYSCFTRYAYRYRYATAGSYCYYNGYQRQIKTCYSKGCQQGCRSGSCYCYSGYRQSGSRCYDIDECSANSGRGPCQTYCDNTVGSYRCRCNSGYYTCYNTRCCPVNCGRPRTPTSCPRSAWNDGQSLTPCKPVPTQSHCSTVFPNSCPLRCPTYYSLARNTGSSPFLRYWNKIAVYSGGYSTRCSANGAWTTASTVAQLYCRRNNDPPETLSLSSTTINEHTPAGTTVGYLTSYDPNKYDTVIYSVRLSSSAIFFSIIGNRLVTTFVPKYNHHQGITGDGNKFTITIRVTDRGSPPMYRDQSFTIRILDANEAPERLALSKTSVRENAAIGTTVGTFSAYDPDNTGTTNPCTWSITGFDTGLFKISGNKLIVAKTLNHEAQNNHPLQVACTDFGRPAATTVETFVIDVLDVNDPPISLTITNSQVDEDAPAGKVVGTLTGLDQDLEKLTITMLPSLQPIGVSGNAANRFRVSSTKCITLPQKDQVKARSQCTADLVVQPKVVGAASGSPGNLDFETAAWFQVVFFARDATHPSLHKSLYTNITVNDVNEAPTDISISNQTIPESAPGGSLVSTLMVTDPDNTQRVVQRPSCTLASGGDNAYFKISGESPNMDLETTTTTVLDYEVKRTYHISVTCNDHGLPPKMITRSFTIGVSDVNEAPENITISNDMVKENVPVGTVIGTFGTIDQDSGDTFTYSFAPGLTDTGPLAIKGNRLETTGPLDFESNDTYAIEVASVDAGGLEVVTSFLIQVVDVPEAPTDITLDGTHTLPENSTSGTLVGNLIVSDQDTNQDPSCKVTGGKDMQYFTTSGDNGLELVASSSAASLDFESVASANILTVAVTCTDLDSLTVTRTFTVTVTDVNEAPTNITIDISTVKENLPANTLVGSLTVTDPDTKQGHNCSVVESQPPAGFVPITSEFYTKNLKLYTKGPLDYESRSSYSVQVECSDQPGAGQPSYVYETPLVINVEDVNEIPGTPCSMFAVGENKPDNTVIAKLNASDPDNEAIQKQSLTYTVTNSVPFVVQADDLLKNGPLNFETKKTYSVDIKVTDDGKVHTSPTAFKTVAPLSKTYTCTVNVEDNNDPHVSASIRMVPPNATVDEHAATGTIIATMVTDDPDANAVHTYSIVETDVPLTMVGDKLTVTSLGRAVNFELDNKDITFTVISRDAHGHSASRQFDVPITNVNEKPSQLCILGTTVSEDRKAGYNIGQLVIADPDYPPSSCSPITLVQNLPYSCTIVDQTAGQIYSSRFEIDSTLQLKLKKQVNYEEYSFYDLRINCQDTKEPLHVVSNTFTISVTNVNEAPTNLTVDASAITNMKYTMVSPGVFKVYIPEHIYDMPVLSFSVEDPDSVKQALVTYSVSDQYSDGSFEMRNNMLYLQLPLDHEGTKMYSLQITASDQGSPPLSTKITVVVNITDNPDAPSQVYLECSGGALFSLQSPKISRRRRQAVNETLPTLPPAQNFNATWGSSQDCSIIFHSMVTDGYLIGKIFPQDQDKYKWYNFTMTGKNADLFNLAPYGKVQGVLWQAAWLRLSQKASSSADARFNFTRGSPVYKLRIDVKDQYGLHEIGQYMNVTTRDACYVGQKLCALKAQCKLDRSVSSGYICQCPPHHTGDGLSASTGCTACAPGDTVVNGKCVHLDECMSQPCMHGSTCTDEIYGFTCRCPAAFSGKRCETKLGTCALQPGVCLNGATCVDTQDDILCRCATGYEGFYCDQQTAACANFPTNCEQKSTAAFCAATPALNGQTSEGLCIDPSQNVHVVMESSCVPTNTEDEVFVHRASQFLETVINDPEGKGDEDFCLYHTAQDQSTSGISIGGTGARRKRAASIGGKQYVVRINQSVFLTKGFALLTVVILDSTASYAAVANAKVCGIMQKVTSMHCFGQMDYGNFSTVLNQKGFFFGFGDYRVGLTAINGKPVSPQSYIELYYASPPSSPPVFSGSNDVNHNGPKVTPASHSVKESDPFYKTPVGIVVICVTCLLVIATIILIVHFKGKADKLKVRYDERLLHSNYDGASEAGSQTSLGDEWRGKFADNKGKSLLGPQGMTNPLYEAANAAGDIQQPRGVEQHENALYESPDAIQEMDEDMDN